jgi:Short C-terminal domain
MRIVRIRISVAVVLLSVGASCATITRGSKDTLVINTTPAGASLELSNGLSGTSPASFKLPRKEALIVKITKDGYESVEVNITPQVSGGGGAGMAGNILFGGLIGAAVDGGSGAMYDLKPNPVEVVLLKTGDDEPTAGMADRLRELKDLLDEGLISEEEYEAGRKAAISSASGN